MLKIAVIGAGYVGLVTGVCLSIGGGRRVVCAEIDAARVRDINRGRAPFFEPRLEGLLRDSLRSGGFLATADLGDALADADIVMVAVGTPPLPSGQSDLRALKSATSAIGRVLQQQRRDNPGRKLPLVVVRSTVPPGTTNGIVRPILQRLCGGDIPLAMIPEFLREGSAVADFLSPDRVVIGADDAAAARIAAKLAVSLRAPIVNVGINEAELTKYASNALLATMVSFSNDIADIAESCRGVDARRVLRALHLDRRLSVSVAGGRKAEFAGICSYLLPGPGYGGSCLPKDLASIRNYAKKRRVPTLLLDAAAKVNDKRAARTAARVAKVCEGLRGRKVALLGLAFKDETSDLRESPSLALARVLQKGGAKVSAFDGYVAGDKTSAAEVRGYGITIAKTPRLALKDADVAMVMTMSPQWQKLQWNSLLRTMRRPIIIDTRGALDNTTLPPTATYQTIGRK